MILRFNWRTIEVMEEVPGPDIYPYAIDVSPDGRYVVVGGGCRKPIDSWGFSLRENSVDWRALLAWDRREKRWHHVADSQWER